MALASKWNGKCKDCGAEHQAGDMIDLNGVKGADGKDHWCKNGKDCQGAMKTSGPVTLENTPWPSQSSKDESAKDPTPEQFLELGKIMLEGGEIEHKENHIRHVIETTRAKIAEVLIKRSVIEEAMNKIGLQHPGRRGFIEDVLK